MGRGARVCPPQTGMFPAWQQDGHATSTAVGPPKNHKDHKAGEHTVQCLPPAIARGVLEDQPREQRWRFVWVPPRAPR